MTLREHLAELRTRLVRIVLAVLAGAVVGWFLYDPVLAFLKQPYCDLPTAFRPAGPDGDCTLVVTRPLEGFAVRVKISLVIGLFIAAPVLFYQVWKFVTPGLTEKERRYTLPFVVTSQIMFLFGAVFAFYVIPKGLQILLALGGQHVSALLAAQEYFSFVLTTVVAFGIVFEVPLLIVFLAAIDLVGTSQLRRLRPYAVVGNFAVAAIVTPTVDPVSMLFMAVPMVLLYEAAIVATWMMERARRRRAIAAEATGGSPA
ncbi:MAG: twin-arginine translocase subunit TatC [Actinomycetota bacterium]|nr:twin-arginine translocase subunit TatC [Actinomycetota bacterium]